MQADIQQEAHRDKQLNRYTDKQRARKDGTREKRKKVVVKENDIVNEKS